MSFDESRLVKKARKDHPCGVCQLNIKKGTSYYRNVGVSYGDFYSYGLHPECHYYWMTFSEGEYLPVFRQPRSAMVLHARESAPEDVVQFIEQNIDLEFKLKEGNS